jgi:hypothetical protein
VKEFHLLLFLRVWADKWIESYLFLVPSLFPFSLSSLTGPHHHPQPSADAVQRKSAKKQENHKDYTLLCSVVIDVK